MRNTDSISEKIDARRVNRKTMLIDEAVNLKELSPAFSYHPERRRRLAP